MLDLKRNHCYKWAFYIISTKFMEVTDAQEFGDKLMQEF